MGSSSSSSSSFDRLPNEILWKILQNVIIYSSDIEDYVGICTRVNSILFDSHFKGNTAFRNKLKRVFNKLPDVASYCYKLEPFLTDFDKSASNYWFVGGEYCSWCTGRIKYFNNVDIYVSCSQKEKYIWYDKMVCMNKFSRSTTTSSSSSSFSNNNNTVYCTRLSEFRLTSVFSVSIDETMTNFHFFDNNNNNNNNQTMMVNEDDGDTEKHCQSSLSDFIAEILYSKIDLVIIAIAIDPEKEAFVTVDGPHFPYTKYFNELWDHDLSVFADIILDWNHFYDFFSRNIIPFFFIRTLFIDRALTLDWISYHNFDLKNFTFMMNLFEQTVASLRNE